MTSPPGTTNKPITNNRLFTSSTSTVRQLCKGRHSPKERHLCQAVEDTEVEEAGTKEADGVTNLLIKITGKIRNVSTAIIRNINQQFPRGRKGRRQSINLISVQSIKKFNEAHQGFQENEKSFHTDTTSTRVRL